MSGHNNTNLSRIAKKWKSEKKIENFEILFAINQWTLFYYFFFFALQKEENKKSN